MTLEQEIENIVEGHRDCRWMDSSELEAVLKDVAAKQKDIDVKNVLIIISKWEDNYLHHIKEGSPAVREQYVCKFNAMAELKDSIKELKV